ncbi:MAG: hypothetical protein ACO1O1_09465 [Adhaeribacter sp.]
MKKIILAMAITVLATGAISATPTAALLQQGPGQGQRQGQGTPEERAGRMTEAMTKQFNLTADQSSKIKPILLARAAEQTELRKKYQGGDRKVAMEEFKKLSEKYNAQIKAVLTAEQYAKYEANQAQRGGGQRQAQGGNE